MANRIKKEVNIDELMFKMAINFKLINNCYHLTLTQYGEWLELIEKHHLTKHLLPTGEIKIMVSIPFYKTYIGNCKIIVENYSDLSNAFIQYQYLKTVPKQ